MAALQPTKRKRQENKYSCCIICQVVRKELLTKRPQMKSYVNILTSGQQRVEYGDLLYSDINDRSKDFSAVTWLQIWPYITGTATRSLQLLHI